MQSTLNASRLLYMVYLYTERKYTYGPFITTFGTPHNHSRPRGDYFHILEDYGHEGLFDNQ